MTKLYYNIYSNISDENFIRVRERLSAIESEMAKVLVPLGWRMHTPVAENDALIVDFVRHRPDFDGNLGIAFNEESQQELFTFYLTKGYDQGKVRSTIRKFIFEDKELPFVEENVGRLLASALETYGAWSKEDIDKRGTSFEMPS